MKFRAVVMGVQEDGRTVQTFCPTKEMAEEWAIQAGAKLKAAVNIYAVREELVSTVNMLGVEETTAAVEKARAEQAGKQSEAKP